MEKKIKILYVITKSDWGGAQRYVYDLAVSLPPDRFDVAVACGGGGPLVERLRRTGPRVIPLPMLQRNISAMKEMASFFSLLRLFIRERPDGIHLNSSKVGGLGALAARVANLATGHRAKVIFTVHGWPFGEERALAARAVIFLLSWISSLLADRTIIVSTADAKRIRGLLPPRKLAPIFHGLGHTAFRPREAARRFFAERTGRPFPAETFVIGTIAELTKNKGLRYLVDAIHQVKTRNPCPEPGRGTKPEFHTLIIGDGEERNALAQHIRTVGLEDTIHLLGFVPEASSYLKGMDLFVLPSVKEGLPYALMEAMAAGLPIVASRVGGIPDLIPDDTTGRLVPPKDPAALAEAIAELFFHTGQRHALGSRARSRIQDEFGIDQMIAKTIALYDAVRPS